MELVQQFASLLLFSYPKGVTDFSILKEELAAEKPVASAAETLYMCKLPRTRFRIISEKNLSGQALVLKAEGYGRGKGKLPYKTGTPPAWWTAACETIIPWNMFAGVNKPKEWKGTWSYAMYDLLLIAYTFFLKEEHLLDSCLMITSNMVNVLMSNQFRLLFLSIKFRLLFLSIKLSLLCQSIKFRLTCYSMKYH